MHSARVSAVAVFSKKKEQPGLKFVAMFFNLSCRSSSGASPGASDAFKFSRFGGFATALGFYGEV